MGMMACLQRVGDRCIEQLLDKSPEDLFEEIEELQEDYRYVLDMDKLWDGLHFLLTGVSACEPPEGNLLSQAIVGSIKFIDDDDSDYIAYTPQDKVKPIVEALRNVKIDELINEFQPKAFAQNGIYPNIWMRENKESLQKELKNCFIELKEFYEKAFDEGNGVVVSIY
jgi:hypothetical protein